MKQVLPQLELYKFHQKEYMKNYNAKYYKEHREEIIEKRKLTYKPKHKKQQKGVAALLEYFKTRIF